MGHVDICGFAGGGAFEPCPKSYLLSTHIEHMTSVEEKCAQRDVDETIKCYGTVHCGDVVVRAGGSLTVDIIFKNKFDRKVPLSANEHIMIFRAEIVFNSPDSTTTIDGAVYDGNLRFVCSGKNFQSSGQYWISFKPMSADNTIKLFDVSKAAFDLIPVSVHPSFPKRLEVPAKLDVNMGVKVAAFTVSVHDEFGNACAKREIEEFRWGFWDMGQQLDFRMKVVASDGSFVISNLMLPTEVILNPAGTVCRFILRGCFAGEGRNLMTDAVELKMLIKHGEPRSLHLEAFPTVIINDSTLPDISACVHDGKNVCVTATGSVIALSDNLTYADLAEPPRNRYLLCSSPLTKGKLSLQRGTIVASDVFKSWREPLQERQASHSAQPPAMMLLEGGKLLLHSELGAFKEGDMVMMREDEVSRGHPSILPNSKPVLARIEKLLPSPQLGAAGGPSPPFALLPKAPLPVDNATVEVTLFDPVYQDGERVKAFAHGYPTQPWWNATVVRRLENGNYLIEWEADAVKDGKVMPQTDLEKAPLELWRSEGREADARPHRKVEARPSAQNIHMRQIVSRAFVFHSSLLQGGLSPAILTKTVWFSDGEGFPKHLQAHVDVFYGDSQSTGAEASWFDTLRSSSRILHARRTVRINPSGRPKYMELWRGDARLQVSKNHFDKATVPDNELYARDSCLQLSLRFLDESGAACTRRPRIIREISWLKSEDEMALADDGTLPAYSVKQTSSLTVEAFCVLDNARGLERLKIDHEIKMQHGDPAKLRLAIVDEESREALKVVAISKQISLVVSVLDQYDEVIPVADKDFELQLRRVCVVDASSSEHAVQSRSEDHRRGVQEWQDVKESSSHAVMVEDDGTSSRFKLPYSRLAGQAGAARVLMEAVLRTPEKTYELSADPLHLDLIAGIASKVKLVHNRFQHVDLGDMSTIFLTSGVAEKGELQVAITDDSENPINVPNGKLSLTLDGKEYAFQKESEGLGYSLTLEAGPYASGEIVGRVSARAGSHTYPVLYIRFRVEKSNSVEGIELTVDQQVTLGQGKSPTLVRLSAKFETEDEEPLPVECIGSCKLVWKGPGGATKRCSLLPSWQFVYGHMLKASAEVPWREPGISHLVLEFAESRPNVRKGKKESNAVRVRVEPGACRPSPRHAGAAHASPGILHH